jgi:leucyl-tRNA synthetase
VLKEAFEKLAALLYPMAPHISEELWFRLGHTQSLLREPWPEYDKNAIKAEEMVIVVQINGKVRSRVTVPSDSSEEEVKQAALDDSKVLDYINGKKVEKVIVVPRKLVNIVAK